MRNQEKVSGGHRRVVYLNLLPYIDKYLTLNEMEKIIVYNQKFYGYLLLIKKVQDLCVFSDNYGNLDRKD